MTSKEFVIWLKGFVVGSNNFNLTPAGWDEVKSELEKVNDGGVSIGTGGIGFINTTATTNMKNLQSGSWHYTNS